ncbi:MAG: GspH/FimT family pseudopilin [Rhodocyclaceae bacterium]
MLSKRFQRGFSLVELIVVVAIMGLLAALAGPELAAWIANSRVRSVAEALQNDLRKAQAEAMRRNHQVAFVLTDNQPVAANVSSVAADAAGRNWLLRVVATDAVVNEQATAATIGGSYFVKGDTIGRQLDITVKATNAMLCFNSMGRLSQNVQNTLDGLALTCAVPTAAAPVQFDIAKTGADRPLRVTVSLAGQVRMCDPSKTLSATKPDGC